MPELARGGVLPGDTDVRGLRADGGDQDGDGKAAVAHWVQLGLEVVGGVLARVVQQSAGTLRLHAFTFASNHFHLLVWARGAALASFIQYLRSNLSGRVGRLVDWRGGSWERRY